MKVILLGNLDLFKEMNSKSHHKIIGVINLVDSSKGQKVSLDILSFIMGGSVLLPFVIVAIINTNFVTDTVDFLFSLSENLD